MYNLVLDNLILSISFKNEKYFDIPLNNICCGINTIIMSRDFSFLE